MQLKDAETREFWFYTSLRTHPDPGPASVPMGSGLIGRAACDL